MSLVSVDGGGDKKSKKGGKIMMHLLDFSWLIATGRIMTFGAFKYERDNWRRGMLWTEIFGGIMRHLSAFMLGQELDPETREPHLAHASCGLMFLFVYSTQSSYKKFDDRFVINNEEINSLLSISPQMETARLLKEETKNAK